MIASKRRPAGVTRSGLLGAATVLALAAASLAWSVGSPVAVLRGFRSPVGPEFDDLLVRSAALAAWVVLGWVGVAALLEIAATLPGSCGRGFVIVAGAISPRLVRQVAQALIGMSVLAGPLAAAPAIAASRSPTSATSSATPDGVRLPDLDRPGGSSQSQPPAARATPAPAPNVLTRGTDREPTEPVYVVRRGDALWDVAARHLGPNASAAEIAHEWPRWYAANRAVIGHDPDLIRPGEVLTPPNP